MGLPSAKKWSSREEEQGLRLDHDRPGASKRSCWCLCIWTPGEVAGSHRNLSVSVTKSQDTQCKVSAMWSPQHLEVTTYEQQQQNRDERLKRDLRLAKRRIWQKEHTEKWRRLDGLLLGMPAAAEGLNLGPFSNHWTSSLPQNKLPHSLSQSSNWPGSWSSCLDEEPAEWQVYSQIHAVKT